MSTRAPGGPVAPGWHGHQDVAHSAQWKTLDPLIARGGRITTEHSKLRAQRDEDYGFWDSVRFACVCAVWLLVSFIAAVTDFYWVYPYKPFGVLLYVSLVLTILMLVLSRFPAIKPKRMWYVQLIAAGTFLGMIVGLIIYYRTWAHYLYYRDSQQYTSVAASQPPDQFFDAGVLFFAADAHIDSSRGLGYLDSLSGVKLCVAPVVDSAMNITAPVSFFAIGIECCDWRSGFSCDSALEVDAKGALLMIETRSLVAPFMSWAAASSVNWQGYEKAIEMAEAAFGINLGQNVRLVRWVKNPIEAMDGYYWRGFIALVICCSLMLVGVLMWGFLHASGRLGSAASAE